MGKRIYDLSFAEAVEALLDGFLVQGELFPVYTYLHFIDDGVHEPYVAVSKVSDVGGSVIIDEFKVTKRVLQQKYRIVQRATRDCLKNENVDEE